MTATLERGAIPGAAPTVTLGGRQVTVERVSARKASRALALIRALSKAVPDLQHKYAAFMRDYERENFVELDRAQARLRYPARPVLDDNGDPIFRDAAGGGQELVTIPSFVDRMTEADWEQSNQRLRMPVTPTTGETIAALLDEALEVAEENVYRLLALFTMSNSDVKAFRRDGTLDTELDRAVDELLDDAMADEVLELGVIIGEVIDDQFVVKARELGDRLGNLRRLVGIKAPATSPTAVEPPAQTSPDGPSSSSPSTSTDSPPSTAPEEASMPSSTSRSTSSSPSDTSESSTSSSDETPN